jgi:predicted  nucleic acid-binding Zn-ribbon protein
LNNENVRRKIDDHQKYLDQLKTEEALLKDKIISYENENNQLDGDINATIDDITNLENQISNAQNDLISLQTDIA